jgi:hypothetical protein
MKNIIKNNSVRHPFQRNLYSTINYLWEPKFISEKSYYPISVYIFETSYLCL